MEDLISIIVPVYNVEKYLGKCLDSIVGQTYHNLEIILVNDGSTDSSENIMHQYADADPRICCVSKEDEGVSSARNAGIKLSKGKYLLFVDSDDYIEKDMVEVLYHMMDPQVTITACGYAFVDHTGQFLPDGKPYKEVFPEKIIHDEKSIWDAYFYEASTYCIVVWNKLFRRELFDDISFVLNRYHEDQFFFNDLLKKKFKMKCTSRKLYYYRVRSQSLMGENSIKEIQDIIDAYIDRMFYLTKHTMFRELGIIYHYSIGLLTKAFGRKNPANKEQLSEVFCGFKKACCCLASMPLPLWMRIKAGAFVIVGRPYIAVRVFLKKQISSNRNGN